MARINILEDAEYLPELSIQLSRTLDEIGLNILTVERRRQSFLFNEHIHRAFKEEMLGFEVITHYFGSQVEGTTTHGLRSDVDILVCSSYMNVIDHLQEWEPGRLNFLMLEDNVAPGYCRLQVMCEDKPMPIPCRTLLNHIRHCYLPNYNITKHGPAIRYCCRPCCADKDIISALQYNRWPRQAEEFTRRKRRGSWPSKTLIQQAIKHGVFLVQAGHRLSSSKELEWRISPSMAERCLMFSLNIVQIKVYVVLKMLVKTYVEPIFGDCISSYHCKTVVLYCLEQTASSFWREDNLMICIRKCLFKLFICVAKCCCPHYIISDENLFDGKVTLQNRRNLLSILSYLIRNSGRSLLRIHFDGIGRHLQSSITGQRVEKPYRDSLATVVLIGIFEYWKQICVATKKREFLVKMNTLDIITITCIVSYHATNSGNIDQQAVQCLCEFLLCWIGSISSSLMIAANIDVYPVVATMIAPFGEKSNVSHLLKLASVFYCYNCFEAAESTLNAILDRYNKHPIRPVCGCNHRYTSPITVSFCSMVYATTQDETLRNRGCTRMFAHCVIFSKHEYYSTPNALRNEFFRSFGDDTKLRLFLRDGWMNLAIVDCLPLLFYLRYITYRELKKHDLQNQSLKLLELCATWDTTLGHPETAWNLLGTCFELDGDNKFAIACFKKSLEMFPTNNAANWHLSTLLYKQTTIVR